MAIKEPFPGQGRTKISFLYAAKSFMNFPSKQLKKEEKLYYAIMNASSRLPRNNLEQFCFCFCHGMFCEKFIKFQILLTKMHVKSLWNARKTFHSYVRLENVFVAEAETCNFRGGYVGICWKMMSRGVKIYWGFAIYHKNHLKTDFLNDSKQFKNYFYSLTSLFNTPTCPSLICIWKLQLQTRLVVNWSNIIW